MTQGSTTDCQIDIVFRIKAAIEHEVEQEGQQVPGVATAYIKQTNIFRSKKDSDKKKTSNNFEMLIFSLHLVN